jgi:hypothetical protein
MARRWISSALEDTSKLESCLRSSSGTVINFNLWKTRMIAIYHSEVGGASEFLVNSFSPCYNFVKMVIP